jgi:Xaa-Pro aminopeptidase
MTDVLEDKRSDPTARELAAFINAMNVDERAALVALAWIGRGTYDKGEWGEALDLARNEHGERTAQYLLGLPLLGDYLEEALAAYGEDCTDFDLGRM